MLGPVRRTEEAAGSEDISQLSVDELIAKAMEHPETREAVLRYVRTTAQHEDAEIALTQS